MTSQSDRLTVEHGDPPGVALGLLFALTLLLSRDSERSLAEQGLTGARAHLLFELQQSGPQTQRTLATALAVAARTMTGLVDGLVASGHVTREPCPGDRRAHLVTLTEHGARTARGLHEGRAELAQALFGQMPAGRLEGMTAGMAEVVERLADHGLVLGYDEEQA